MHESISFLPTGFAALDQILHGGLRLGEVTLVAGRPGMGTSTFLQYLVYYAEQSVNPNRLPSIYVNLQIHIDSVQRQLQKIYQGKESRGLVLAVPESSWQIPSFEVLLWKLKALSNEGHRLIAVDRLQDLLWDLPASSPRRGAQINYILSQLRKLAKGLDLAVVVGSTLPRKTESFGYKGIRPSIKNSFLDKELISYCSTILFLFRPEYYGIIHSPEGEYTQGLMEVIVERASHTDDENICQLRFNGEKRQIIEWTW